jgi:hypothetical protein
VTATPARLFELAEHVKLSALILEAQLPPDTPAEPRFAAIRAAICELTSARDALLSAAGWAQIADSYLDDERTDAEWYGVEPSA